LFKLFLPTTDFQLSNSSWNPITAIFTSNFKINSLSTYFCDANAPPFFKLYSQYIFYA
jgi:hypothetical protein